MLSLGSIVLIAIVAFSLLTALLPTTRRIWAFQLYAWKYALIWLWDRITFRRRYTFPELLRLFSEDMGPTFIKFGQIIASSTGVFPKRWSEEFQKCLDRVKPFAFESVQQIVTEELGADAARLKNLGPVPLASASIAQVHTAELADGESVVVKVQRPGIASRVAADMQIMRLVAKVAEKLIKDAELVNPVGIVEDFAATLREELDFRKEGKNLEQFNAIMKDLAHADVRAPKPVTELTTARVLVMERFHGIRVDDVEKIRKRDVDIEERLVKGMRAWFQSVLFHGFFHGDVHAGNLMLLDNNDVGFLDFGIVGRFDKRQRAMVTDYLVAFVSADYKALAKVITDMGGLKKDVKDMDAFAEDLQKTYSPLLKMAFNEINYAEILPSIQKVASKHRMSMPKEFVLITKQMLYFDRYARLLAPTLNVFSDPRLVSSLMMDVMKARMDQQKEASASPA